jgi:putative hydrolase of the HAD superfamily
VKIPSPVKCVLFDAVGTLIYADPPVSAVYRAAAREFGLTLDEPTIARRFVNAFARHNREGEDAEGNRTDDARERDRWRAIVANVFPELNSSEALLQQLWEHFAKPVSWRLYEDATDCWQRLHERGLQPGIASNFDSRLLSIARGLLPLDTSAHIFVSSQLGFRKPAVEFFRAIEQALDLQPHELLLVGDDWRTDYLAARSAGWQAVYLDRDQPASSPASIRSLGELA